MKNFFVSLRAGLILQGNVFAGDEDVLAKIGDKKITARDFEVFISSYPPERQKLLSESPKNKENLLKRMAQITALADLARAENLDKNERIKMQVEYYANEILATELMNEESRKIEVTENDMQLYYKIHEEEFRVPERVKARHLVVRLEKGATDDDKKKAKDKAGDIKDKGKTF
jgi:peptidyl-prolyl cis-trans isomerase C